MPKTPGFDTPFTDYTAPKPAYAVVPTLGNLSSRQVNSADAHVTHSDAPEEYRYNDLHHDTPEVQNDNWHTTPAYMPVPNPKPENPGADSY